MTIALNMSSLHTLAARFDAMSMRERALISVATLAALLMLWNMILMQPLVNRQKALQAELDEVSSSMSTTATAMEEAMAPTNAALAQLQAAKTELTTIDAQLAATAAGMIAPERMAEVIQDVLHKQHALKLISVRNGAASSLVGVNPENAASDSTDAATDPATAPATGSAVKAVTKPTTSGPYVHPLELVVEGSYTDIVEYLHALETLQWHLYWNRLELQTKQYPMNRVQIDISTLSLDSAWLGI